MTTQSVSRKPSSEPVASLENGRALGSYQLVLPIGSGGMGRVWIAVRRGDFGFKRMFAVKVMREDLASDGAFRRMFLDEAKLASRIRHSNVVEVLDLGEVDGTVYQAMALIDGDSLSGLVKLAGAGGLREDGPVVPVDVAGRIIADVLRGLHAAHELGDDAGRPLHLVHRDVSPQNILVGLDGVAKIADFGVAKAVGVVDPSQSPVGKRSYMAPEQLRGRDLDRRCDVFSAGVVLWELLTGRRAGPVATRLLAGESLPDPRALVPSTHPGLADVALRALATAPEARYPTADAMADAIEHAAFDSGLALRSKAVAAWVGGLVGSRVSRQREDARREIEQTLATAGLSAEVPLPESMQLATSGPTASAPARRSVLVRGAAVLAVLLVAGASTLAWTTRRGGASASATAPPPAAAGGEGERPTLLGASDDEIASLAAADASAEERAAAAAIRSTADAAAAAEPPAAPSRAAPARRPAPRTRRAASPSLPYDNPYAR